MDKPIPPIYKELLHDLLIMFYCQSENEYLSLPTVKDRVDEKCQLITAHNIITDNVTKLNFN